VTSPQTAPTGSHLVKGGAVQLKGNDSNSGRAWNRLLLVLLKNHSSCIRVSKRDCYSGDYTSVRLTKPYTAVGTRRRWESGYMAVLFMAWENF